MPQNPGSIKFSFQLLSVKQQSPLGLGSVIRRNPTRNAQEVQINGMLERVASLSSIIICKFVSYSLQSQSYEEHFIMQGSTQLYYILV